MLASNKPLGRRFLIAIVCGLPAAMAGLAIAEQPASESTTPSVVTINPRAEPQVIPAEALQADLDTLQRAMEAVHPGLYRSNTPEQMAANFAATRAAFSKGMTRVDAFIELSKLTAKIRCGHTYPSPYNQSKQVMAELTQGSHRVPFEFRWLNRQMIVTKDLSKTGRLLAGTEILAINGTPSASILDTLMTVARADGGNDAKRVALMEVRGNDTYEAFDIYWPLFFPSDTGTIRLSVRRPGEAVESEISVAGLTHADRIAAMKPDATNSANDPLWSLSFLDDTTAFLPMPSWVAYKTKWDWTKFLNDTFDALASKKTPNLIIDLRGNEGGSDVGDVILARLIEAPIPLSHEQRMVRYLKTPADLNSILDTWDDSFRDRTPEAIGPIDLADRSTGLPAGTTSGFYRLREGDSPTEIEDTIKPVGPRYTGKLFVLIDATNSSATFQFAFKVKALGVGTLVGQPTGGNQRGINGGAFFFVRLPQSGLEVDLPQIARFPKPGQPLRDDAGVTPDVFVTPTADSVAKGIDVELDAVKRIIAKSAKPGS